MNNVTIGPNFKSNKTVIGFKSYSRVCRCSSQVYSNYADVITLFSKMFPQLPGAFVAQKWGPGHQYFRLRSEYFLAPKVNILGSRAIILGSKASTLNFEARSFGSVTSALTP